MRKSMRWFMLVWIIVLAGYAYEHPASAPRDVLANRSIQQKMMPPGTLHVTCSPEKPVVSPRDTIRVRAWAAPPAGEELHYTWSVTAGRLEGDGAEARWSFTGVEPGPYTATIRVSNLRVGLADCSVHVIVRPRPPMLRGSPRESGWSFLFQGKTEQAGYGLYSYLLFGSPPSSAARDHYLKAIEAYVELVPNIRSLEAYIARPELNITYLPITVPLWSAISPERLLEQYDYARARFLLRALPGTHRDGPYIVSALKPLSGTGTLSDPYLYQDLSSVPPHLVSVWVKEFLNQAAQERFWEKRTTEQFALKLRRTVGTLALGLPDVLKASETWVAWIR
jgi:hypothetical protein